MQVYNTLKEQVIDGGLCTHCGLCAGLSEGQLTMQETAAGPLPRPAAGIHPQTIDLPNEALTACPGYQVDYPALYQHVFGAMPENRLAGNCKEAFISYATDAGVRRQGASGGVITQALLYLLESGQIDGAVVVQQGVSQPWQAQPIIARTREDILRASQSVYAPVPVNTILAQLNDESGRLAFVGLPDQVAAIRQLQRVNHPAVACIEYILGPYVGTNMTFEAVRSFLRSNGVPDAREIAVLRYREGEWPGYLYIKLKDGREFKAEKFYYNYLIPFYITNGTLFAVDFTNELTDFSVGDAWSPSYEERGKGFSVVLARTERGLNLLHEMQEAGLITLDATPLDEALAMHGHMLDFKKRGAFIRLQWRRWRGLPVPDYGYQPRDIPLSRYLVECIVSGLFLVGRTRLARWIVEQIPLSVIGPFFNFLRQTWKRFSKPVKRQGLQTIDFVETTPHHD